MKLKMALAALALPAICAAACAAGTYGIINMQTPGLYEPVGISIGQLKQIDVAGSSVATGTVVISSVSRNGATTNALATVTCASGNATAAYTNSTVFILAGDRLLRSGTATNGTVRIIVTQ